ncbi:MAG: rRNA ((1402)-2-O)-methyltransferase [Gammaproteobacteria bacterium]|jgi:16S rRNA (cytidine1402-2'-O)-methyltransferase|nr:rRNA ((1402)-2-O)-methyltransferase [Gammaproteobacteria bacterium]
MKINQLGVLYIVATPIGNLQDISLRAIDVLKTVNCIAAEDTRHSQHLLQHFSITTPLLSLHEHNESERTSQLIHRLQRGESIALISDAGTPLISDPGYILVRDVKSAGIQVMPIPGACAAIAALSASGLPTDRFIFEGFLSTKSKLRKERLAALKTEPRTLIIYETPHRILGSLQEMQQVFGKDRFIVLARELTKIFETIQSGTIEEIIHWIMLDTNQQRGEIILLVKGADIISNPKESITTSAQAVLIALLEELPLKQAVGITAKITGERKNNLYQRALLIKSIEKGLKIPLKECDEKLDW